MKKKILTILSAIIMLFAVFLCEGCLKTNNPNDSSGKVNDVNQGGGKPIIPARIWLKNFEKKEFSSEEDVTVELCHGTLDEKAFIEGFVENDDFYVDIFGECYQGKQIGNWYGTKEPDVEALLLRIEDFYAENYPLSLTEDSKVAPSSIVTLPKTLFVGEDGVIIIKMDYLELCISAEMYYKVDGEKIILGGYKDIYSTHNSQAEILE